MLEARRHSEHLPVSPVGTVKETRSKLKLIETDSKKMERFITSLKNKHFSNDSANEKACEVVLQLLKNDEAEAKETLLLFFKEQESSPLNKDLNGKLDPKAVLKAVIKSANHDSHSELLKVASAFYSIEE